MKGKGLDDLGFCFISQNNDGYWGPAQCVVLDPKRGLEPDSNQGKPEFKTMTFPSHKN